MPGEDGGGDIGACVVCARQPLEAVSSTAESSVKSMHSEGAHGTEGGELASLASMLSPEANSRICRAQRRVHF